MAAAETRSLRLADGTELVADIWRPAGPGPHPVLLMRQPYGRKIASTVTFAHPAWYAAQGYIVVVQDVRGAGDSGGRFRVLADDAADGAATLDWAADLPGASGKVGTYGFSYQGMSQLLALAGAGRTGGKRPDAMLPAMAGWSVRDDWAFDGGCFRMAGGIGWAAQMGALQARRAGDGEAFQALLGVARSGGWQGERPARPEALARLERYHHYQEWLADRPATWAAMAPAQALADDPLDVPALHVGGWQDILLGGTLASHAAFTAKGDAPQRLLVGPWLHIPWGRMVGGRDLGPDAALGIDREALAFFDLHLKGRGEAGPAVRLFDLGTRRWRELPAMPETRPLLLNLVSTGLAAMTGSDGALLPDPSAAASDMLVHDPWRPAPAIGGATGQPPGFQDRTAIDDRSDVAVYTGRPLEKPLDLVGEPLVELEVECDRPSHDLHCTLSLVGAEGRVVTLTQGCLRVADSAAPGPRRVRLQATCCTVPSGTSLRLSVQAAAWPAYMINPGTGERPEDARLMDCQVTTLAIRHGGGTRSRLLLPVVPA